MICQQCSQELPEGSAFCNRCGAAQQGAPGLAAVAGAPAAEETLWTGRYSLRAAAHVWLLWTGWIGLVATVYLGFVSARSSLAGGIALALALVPGLWALGKALLRKATLRFRLTSHRLFSDRGLLSRRHDELELIRVDDVSVQQNLLQRWLGVGTVTLVSTDASNPRLALEGIVDPLGVKERIRTSVRALRARTTFLETL